MSISFADADPKRASRRPAPGRLLGALLCLVSVACGGEDGPTEVQDPVEDPCTQSVDIALGQSTSGTLSSTDCRHQPSGAYGDRWSLTLATAIDVRIDLTSSAFDAYLELQTNSGTVIAANDDAGGLNSRIIEPLQAGSYIIVARSLNPSGTGSYQLSVAEGPDCSPIGALSLGVTETGALETSDCLFDFGGFMDNWSLSLPNAQKLRIDLKSAEFDEIVLVRDQQGQIINGADWFGPTGHARLEAQIPAGDWTISAASWEETQLGAYELTADVAPPCTPGTDVVFGTTEAGEITASDCTLDGFLAADSFAVAVSQETPVSIQLKSPDFPPLLFLRDQAGLDVEIGFDDNGDGSAWINTTLSTGTYALFATSGGGPQAQGSYTLTVSEIVCPAPGAITFGQTVSGALDAGDCLRSSGAFQESWELVLPATTNTRIDLVSTDFDAYLELKDSQGIVIEADDDDGAGLNSRIDRSLAAGTYEIVASSFGTGQVGDYELTVGAPPPAASAAPDSDAGARAAKALTAEDGSASSVLERIRAEREARTERWRLSLRPKGQGRLR